MQLSVKIGGTIQVRTDLNPDVLSFNMKRHVASRITSQCTWRWGTRQSRRQWICKWTAMRTPLTERKRYLLHNARGHGEAKQYTCMAYNVMETGNIFAFGQVCSHVNSTSDKPEEKSQTMAIRRPQKTPDIFSNRHADRHKNNSKRQCALH